VNSEHPDRPRRLVDVGEALAIINARQDVSDDELARLSGDAPEIVCPACSATIRARMADNPQQLARALARVAAEARDALSLAEALGLHLGPLKAALADATRAAQRSGPLPAPTSPPVCPVHRIPGAGREPIAVPVISCRQCAEWSAGGPVDDTPDR
jgi:hypothetical protein